MTKMKDHQLLLAQLKKQVKALQARESHNRRLLSQALKKLRALSKAYKNSLAGKLRVIKTKLIADQAELYEKVAANLEQQLRAGLKSQRQQKKMKIKSARKKD